MLIEELIFERSRASLYHFTDLKGAYGILTSNMMNVGDSEFAETEWDISNAISFTRNPNYDIRSGKFSIRFELDQDKLKTKYKIRPHVWKKYLQNKYLTYMHSPYGEIQGNTARHESEEIIIGPIKNINAYITEINVSDHSSHDLHNTLYNLYHRIDFTEPNFYNIKEFSSLKHVLAMLKELINHPKFVASEIKDIYDDIVDLIENEILWSKRNDA